MKLAIATFDFPPEPGGVQAYLLEVSRRLQGVTDVEVVTPVPADPAVEGEPPRSRPTPDNVVGYWRALRRAGPDLVLVGHAHPQLLLAALCTGRRYAALAYGNDFLAAQRRWHAPLFNLLLRHARPVMASSDVVAERLLSLASISAITVRPGTDPERFRPPETDPPPDPPRLLSVGRLVPRKGIDVVIRALPQLLERFPRLRYEVAGDGPQRPELERLASALGVRAAVSFLGRLTDDQLRAAYQRSHVFVLPVREERGGTGLEGFGIVFLEAAACGLPVVAGRSGGAIEAVRDGETGDLVDPEDPAALAEHLLALLSDPERRRRLGTAGRRWVEREMTWDRTAREAAEAMELGSP